MTSASARGRREAAASARNKPAPLDCRTQGGGGGGAPRAPSRDCDVSESQYLDGAGLQGGSFAPPALGAGADSELSGRPSIASTEGPGAPSGAIA